MLLYRSPMLTDKGLGLPMYLDRMDKDMRIQRESHGIVEASAMQCLGTLAMQWLSDAKFQQR